MLQRLLGQRDHGAQLAFLLRSADDLIVAGNKDVTFGVGFLFGFDQRRDWPMRRERSSRRLQAGRSE